MSFNRYSYCLNNPLMFKDPGGQKIVFAEGVSDEFKAAFAQSIKHLNDNNAAGVAARLEASDRIYYVNEVSSMDKVNFDSRTNTINWAPNLGLHFDETGVTISPTTILNHEFKHAENYDKALNKFIEDCKNVGYAEAQKNLNDYYDSRKIGSDSQYDTKQERSVITTSEQYTAKALGEIGEGQVTRTNHNKGFPVIVSDPTSNKVIKIVSHLLRGQSDFRNNAAVNGIFN